MNNTNNNTTYKLSEVLLSFLIVIAAGLSFSVTHYNSGVFNGSVTNLPRMRGHVRQHIQMGTPEVWISNVTKELEGKGIKVSISKLKGAWFVDAVFGGSLSDLERQKLLIFLERYGVNIDNINELHISLSGFN